ncbi:MAG: sensor histidine kinase [Sphingomonadales bacterium]
MTGNKSSLPPLRKSLSVRLLVLTALFVILSEILVFVPSIARFRESFLEQRLDAAHLASLALEATDNNLISKELERQILRSAQVEAVIVKRIRTRMIMLNGSSPPPVTARYDFRNPGPMVLIRDAFVTLWRGGGGNIHVIGPLPGGGERDFLEIIFDEQPLWLAMVEFAGRILGLTILISLVTASLVYWSLHRLLVKPMREITHSMVAFREAPEDVSRTVSPSGRSDEVGTAERELARMQEDLRAALKQKTHLAHLGAAVSRINHDLRNSLTSAQLVSDRLGQSGDPTVRRLTPRLVSALDRATELCTQTLKYGRSNEPPPRRIRFELAPLIDDIAIAAGLPENDRIRWRNRVEGGFEIDADPDHVYRVLLNLGRNAVQALAGAGKGGEISISGEQSDGVAVIEVSDSGPGLPKAAREHLFEPFAGSTRAEGTGLGLAISRELARAHGGDIELVESGPNGTTFRISIPDRNRGDQW